MKKRRKKKKCFHFLRILSLNRKVSTSTLCVNYVINKGKREKWEAEMMKNIKILTYPEPCNQKRELRERDKESGWEAERNTNTKILTYPLKLLEIFTKERYWILWLGDTQLYNTLLQHLLYIVLLHIFLTFPQTLLLLQIGCHTREQTAVSKQLNIARLFTHCKDF